MPARMGGEVRVMSDREWHWQNATGCSAPGEANRLLLEQAELIRKLADSLEGMTYMATGLHTLYRGFANASSDGSHEKAFAEALALVKKARKP